MPDTPDIVLVEHRDRIAILTLNEPERLNPIVDDMRAGLLRAVEGGAFAEQRKPDFQGR